MEISEFYKMSMDPTSIILCGQVEALARSVIEGLQREYEALHVVLSKSQAVAELSSILAGTPLPQSLGKPLLGSQNFETSPGAIVVGGGYDDKTFEAMREAYKHLGPAYGELVIARIKAKLTELRENGKLGVDGVYVY